MKIIDVDQKVGRCRCQQLVYWLVPAAGYWLRCFLGRRFLHSSPSPLLSWPKDSALVAESADFASISPQVAMILTFHPAHEFPHFSRSYLGSLLTAMGKRRVDMRMQTFSSWDDFEKAVERVRPGLMHVSLMDACAAWNNLNFVEQAAVRPENTGPVGSTEDDNDVLHSTDSQVLLNLTVEDINRLPNADDAAQAQVMPPKRQAEVMPPKPKRQARDTSRERAVEDSPRVRPGPAFVLGDMDDQLEFVLGDQLDFGDIDDQFDFVLSLSGPSPF